MKTITLDELAPGDIFRIAGRETSPATVCVVTDPGEATAAGFVPCLYADGVPVMQPAELRVDRWYGGAWALEDARYGCDPFDTFTTQEGAVFRMHGATCPNGHPSHLAHRRAPAGYFHCPECGFMYDEPTFAGEESFVTSYEEEEV